MKKLALLFAVATASVFGQATTQVIQSGGDACRAIQGIPQKVACIDQATVFVSSSNPRAEGFRVELRYSSTNSAAVVSETRIIPAFQIPGSSNFVGVIMLDWARNVGATAKTLVSE